MIEVFTELAHELERRWRDREYDERVFAELATASLGKRRLDREVSVDDLMAWALTTDPLPVQFDPESKFGQPPLTLVRAQHFAIDALFWMEGTTDIHQHGFSGAFQVLSGSSVHARYAWELRDRVNAAIQIGDVRFRGFELLAPGDTRTIGSGGELIHGLFHLERPSVTLVVRTFADRECGPQYNYHEPHIATDPLVIDSTLRRRLEVLRLEKQLGRDHDAAYAELLARADYLGVFLLARHYLHLGGEVARILELLERARPRHGARIDALPPVFVEMLRKSAVIKKREVVTSADHRFFLGMLLNLPTRTAILEAISRRYPDGDTIDRVVGWVRDLASALGEPPSTDHSSVVLAEMLRGHAGERLLAQLDEEFDIEEVRAEIVDLERRLRQAPTLRTLLT